MAWIELARPQRVRRWYGDIDLTPALFSSLKEEFYKTGREVPLTNGHMWASEEALGWVTGVDVIDGVLYGDIEPTESLREKVARKELRQRSIGFRVTSVFTNEDGVMKGSPKTGVLDHVAMLGASQPAISGMPPIEGFSATECLFTVDPVDNGEQLTYLTLRAPASVHSSPLPQPMAAQHTVETLEAQLTELRRQLNEANERAEKVRLDAAYNEQLTKLSAVESLPPSVAERIVGLFNKLRSDVGGDIGVGLAQELVSIAANVGAVCAPKLANVNVSRDADKHAPNELAVLDKVKKEHGFSSDWDAYNYAVKNGLLNPIQV